MGIMFHSTNYNTPDVDFKTAIIRGQALDKGLYMLNEIPKLDKNEIYLFKDLELYEIGYIIISKLIGDIIPEDDLKKIINNALNFKVPVKQIDKNDYICYLDEGPTCSFKDIGARNLARYLEFF